MRLDLVITTFRRPELLTGALHSVLAAPRPADLDLHVIVVNNDPSDPLPDLDRVAGSARVPILRLDEPRAGKSNALNTAVRSSTAEFVGFIDDDERVAPSWLQVAYDALRTGTLDFIGGPMLPIWPGERPSWIPETYSAVIGIVDSGPTRVRYTHEFRGILVGGNAVIRRSMFDSIGFYAPDLGPRACRRLMSCEDEDMYARLLAAGARGEYLPDLVVHHHVHHERLSPRYYRAWCFWNGVSKATLSSRRPSGLPGIAGVPRYVYGRALRGLAGWFAAVAASRGAAARLESELPVWQLLGYLYGRFAGRGASSRRTRVAAANRS